MKLLIRFLLPFFLLLTSEYGYSHGSSYWEKGYYVPRVADANGELESIGVESEEETEAGEDDERGESFHPGKKDNSKSAFSCFFETSLLYSANYNSLLQFSFYNTFRKTAQRHIVFRVIRI